LFLIEIFKNDINEVVANMIITLKDKVLFVPRSKPFSCDILRYNTDVERASITDAYFFKQIEDEDIVNKFGSSAISPEEFRKDLLDNPNNGLHISYRKEKDAIYGFSLNGKGEVLEFLINMEVIGQPLKNLRRKKIDVYSYNREVYGISPVIFS
jgi:hypothetical protein